jgi:hypothetical protein
MKQITLFYLSLLFINYSYSQSSKEENLWNGTGIFILGSDRSTYGLDLKLMGRDTLGIKKSYQYEYLPAQNSPFIIASVKFNTVWLFFNEKNKLGGVFLLTTYKKTDSTNYLKEAEEGSYQIILYLKTSLKRKGVEKYKNQQKNATTIQYEWVKKKGIVYFSMVQGKIPDHEFITLTVDFGISAN